MVIRVLLAFSVLATAFLLWGLGSPQAAPSASSWEFSGGQQLAAPHQPQEEKEEIKDFKGALTKAGAKFLLEESANGGNYGTYLLDDQSAARKYEGQRVIVIVTLDAPHNTIHVRRIEAVA
jgi:hypothetical protein